MKREGIHSWEYIKRTYPDAIVRSRSTSKGTVRLAIYGQGRGRKKKVVPLSFYRKEENPEPGEAEVKKAAERLKREYSKHGWHLSEKEALRQARNMLLNDRMSEDEDDEEDEEGKYNPMRNRYNPYQIVYSWYGSAYDWNDNIGRENIFKTKRDAEKALSRLKDDWSDSDNGNMVFSIREVEGTFPEFPRYDVDPRNISSNNPRSFTLVGHGHIFISLVVLIGLVLASHFKRK